MAVLPADHYIEQTREYQKIVSAALTVAREPGRMVVLGIPPTLPETGFGYIERMDAAIGANSIPVYPVRRRSEEHTSELQSHSDLHSFPTRRSSDLWPCCPPIITLSRRASTKKLFRRP